MKQDVLAAEAARNIGDVIEMMKYFQKLKEYEL